jgi:hypothetical protein
MNRLMTYGKEMTRFGIGYGGVTAMTTWLAHSITKVGLLHGFGFGAVAGVVTVLAYGIINKPESIPLSLGLSITVGGATGLAASGATAALGFAAAPITLSGAALCTGVLLTQIILIIWASY